MSSLLPHLSLLTLLVALPLAAQPAPASVPKALSQAEGWRVANQIRTVAALPPGTDVEIDGLTPSELAGYEQLHFRYTHKGQPDQAGTLLISIDHMALAELHKYNTVGKMPTEEDLVGLPGRNGGAGAPVTVVLFDDLECPFCARLNRTLPHALKERYGEKVRIVYMEFPIEGHPWARHAAIDALCLRQQSPEAYWELIDAVHEKAGTISGAQEIEQSYKALDQMTVFAGSEHGVDGARLESCLLKQDAALVEHSLAVGQRVGVNQTPTFFVNGARVLGVASEEFVFSLVDKALQAK